jgi:hypothetical protein
MVGWELKALSLEVGNQLPLLKANFIDRPPRGPYFGIRH